MDEHTHLRLHHDRIQQAQHAPRPRSRRPSWVRRVLTAVAGRRHDGAPATPGPATPAASAPTAPDRTEPVAPDARTPVSSGT